MHVVLWDTRQLDVAKDFAGGFGVGQYHGHGGFRGQMIRWAYKRDRRPVALNFAYLAAIFRQLGHTVEYVEDHAPTGADLYVFNPSLITLHLEIAAIRDVLAKNPRAKVFIIGLVGYALPEVFKNLDVTIVRGEPERLLWKLDDVLADTTGTVDVGSVRELDHLPFPDWSPFDPAKFRIGYDFTRFPTGLIQQSRGCTFTCNYCPYIIVENTTRFRTPESVFEELRHGMQKYGFRSFKFRDPLFGLDRKRVLRLAELIAKLPRKIEFSIESRIDLLRPDTLRILREVGLTSITVGIETPDEGTLKQYKRAPIKDDKQRDFVTLCRGLGIRTVAGFMIGFPGDTVDSIRHVLAYAKSANPTYANFNIVTPYPGTEFFQQVKDQIADFDFTKYNVYTPVMKYEHLTPEQVQFWHAKCFMRFFFRWEWLTSNAHLLWPKLRLLGVGRKYAKQAAAMVPATQSVEQTKPAGLPILDRTRELRADQPHRHATTDKPAGTKKPL
jgi:anaerobic magnesium-protoporphyrin IX monomethyl ester cyclase